MKLAFVSERSLPFKMWLTHTNTIIQALKRPSVQYLYSTIKDCVKTHILTEWGKKSIKSNEASLTEPLLTKPRACSQASVLPVEDADESLAKDASAHTPGVIPATTYIFLLAKTRSLGCQMHHVHDLQQSKMHHHHCSVDLARSANPVSRTGARPQGENRGCCQGRPW